MPYNNIYFNCFGVPTQNFKFIFKIIKFTRSLIAYETLKYNSQTKDLSYL